MLPGGPWSLRLVGDLSDSSQDSSEVGLISASHKETDPQRGKVIPQCWGGAGAEPGTCHQGEREVEGVQMGQREAFQEVLLLSGSGVSSPSCHPWQPHRTTNWASLSCPDQAQSPGMCLPHGRTLGCPPSKLCSSVGGRGLCLGAYCCKTNKGNFTAPPKIILK